MLLAICITFALQYSYIKRKGFIVTTKTATINVRVDPDAKKAADETLSEIGVSMSSVVNALIRKIAREKRVPFELSLPMKDGAINADAMSDEQLADFLQYRVDQSKKTKGFTVAEAKHRIDRLINERDI